MCAIESERHARHNTEYVAFQKSGNPRKEGRQSVPRAGGLIHLLLIVALISLVLHLFRGRKMAFVIPP
jgi:hypothetical protein